MDLVKFSAPSDPAVNQWAADINAACYGTNVPPCLLAAIIKRESKGRNIFQEGMLPGPGCGVGLCQITYAVDWASLDHPTYGGLDLTVPANNLRVAVRDFLSGLVASAVVAQKESPISFTVSCKGQIVYAVACGYNAGWDGVARAMAASQLADTFIPTTGGEDGPYGENVLAIYTAYVNESHK